MTDEADDTTQDTPERAAEKRRLAQETKDERRVWYVLAYFLVRAELDVPQREAGLLQHLPCIVGQRHLSVALEVCGTHVSRIPSGALTAVTEQSHQFSGGDLDLALEAGDVFGQGLLDLVELGLCPGILAWANRQ